LELSDEDQIRAVVEDYLSGMMFADEERLRRAFHAHAKSIGYEGDRFEWDSLDAFIAACQAAGRLPPDTSYEARILWLEITGNMAVVKLEDIYRDMRYTDYLTLMRIDGTWAIINKAFFNHG
jgi:hypothetical protein